MTTNEDVSQEALENLLKKAESGTFVRRLKFGRVGGSPILIKLLPDHQAIAYKSGQKIKCLPERWKQVEICDINDVRSGWLTDGFQKIAAKAKFSTKHEESTCFSIVFQRMHKLMKSVDLVADTSENQRLWQTVIKHLINRLKKETVHFNEENWLKTKFVEADKDKSGALTFQEVFALLTSLNLEISYYHARTLFEKAQSEGGDNSLMTFDEFVLFFRFLTNRPDLQEIIRKNSNTNSDFWTPDDLQKFLSKQRGKFSLDECQKLIEKYEPDASTAETFTFTSQGLRQLLLEPKFGNIFNEPTGKQDMTRPLTDYFMKSSHNTYLCGHQLHGDATIEGYINALKMGYKFLELDVWDGSHGPIITHGLTLVKPIMFKDVIKTIDKFAFCASPYPVVLSIENHCGVKQQDEMAKIMKKTFETKLFYFSETELTSLKSLPSPEKLKNKILVKAKGHHKTKTTVTTKSQVANTSVECNNNYVNIVTIPDGYESDDSDDEESNGSKKKKQVEKSKTKQVSEELSGITALPSAKVKNWKTALVANPPNSYITMLEDKLPKVDSPDYADMLKYAKNRLIKIYPSGLRTSSSNVNPVEFWTSGIQTVALNAQTAGTSADLNDALFMLTGMDGYVLKPEILRTNAPESVSREPKTIYVEIISGHYLPKPPENPPIFTDIIDPYVIIEVYGFPCDQQKFKTKVIDNNGFNPVWNEKFELKIHYPELAFLQFCVKDKDVGTSDDFIGECSLPISLLRPGYGHLRLRTGFEHKKDPSAVLFVCISM